MNEDSHEMSSGRLGPFTPKKLLAGITIAVIGGVLTALIANFLLRDDEPSQGPVAAIRSYYDIINDGDYSTAWSKLSEKFKTLKHGDENGDIDYDSFIRWWRQVDYVSVVNAELVDDSKSRYVVRTQLNYLMKSGRVSNEVTIFELVLDAEGKWLIDWTEVKR